MGFFSDVDWNKVAEKSGEFVKKAGEQVEKKQQELIKKFKIQLKRMDDQKIRNGLRDIDCSDWRYEYIQEEANRRGL